MPTIQYTLRNIPPALDKTLRKRAKMTGKSLNQIVLDDLATHNHLPHNTKESMSEMLGWFIGRGVDDETLVALQEEDRLQKRYMAERDWRK